MTPAQISLNMQAISLIHMAFRLLQLLVLARVIISWVRVDPRHPLVRLIHDLTEPMLRPLRSMLRVQSTGLDFSPMILLLLLWVAERIIVNLVPGAF